MPLTGPETGFVVSDSSYTISANTSWVVGDNTYGQIGDGTVIRSPFKQIGALTNWKQVAYGEYHRSEEHTSELQSH